MLPSGALTRPDVTSVTIYCSDHRVGSINGASRTSDFDKIFQSVRQALFAFHARESIFKFKKNIGLRLGVAVRELI